MKRWNAAAKIKTLALAALILLFLTDSKLLGHPNNPRNFTTLADALSAIRSNYGVTTGLEISPTESDNIPITLQLPSSDPAEAFHNLVAQRPQYTWSLQDGVYDLYPKTKTDNLSDLVLKTYLLNDVTLAEASQALNSLPEFQTWLSTRKLTRREFQIGPAWNPKQRRSLGLSDVPLRSVLNQMIKNFTLTNWTVVRYGDRKEYIAIYFRND